MERILIFLLVLILAAIVFGIYVKSRKKQPKSKAQSMLRAFVCQELGEFKGRPLDYITAKERTDLGTDHLWVVAYGEEECFFIPALQNEDGSITREHKVVEQLRTNSLTNIHIDDRENHARICVEGACHDMYFDDFDICHANQKPYVEAFFRFLRRVKNRRRLG